MTDNTIMVVCYIDLINIVGISLYGWCQKLANIVLDRGLQCGGKEYVPPHASNPVPSGPSGKEYVPFMELILSQVAQIWRRGKGLG